MEGKQGICLMPQEERQRERDGQNVREGLRKQSRHGARGNQLGQ